MSTTREEALREVSPRGNLACTREPCQKRRRRCPGRRTPTNPSRPMRTRVRPGTKRPRPAPPTARGAVCREAGRFLLARTRKGGPGRRSMRKARGKPDWARLQPPLPPPRRTRRLSLMIAALLIGGGIVLGQALSVDVWRSRALTTASGPSATIASRVDPALVDIDLVLATVGAGCRHRHRAESFRPCAHQQPCRRGRDGHPGRRPGQRAHLQSDGAWL